MLGRYLTSSCLLAGISEAPGIEKKQLEGTKQRTSYYNSKPWQPETKKGLTANKRWRFVVSHKKPDAKQPKVFIL